MNYVKWSKKGLVLLHGVCSYIIPFLFDVSWLQSLNSYYYMWTWDWEAPGWRGWKRYVSMDTRFSAASRLPFHPNTATQSKLISQILITPNVSAFWDKRQHQGTPSNINATELHFKGTSNNIPLRVYSEVGREVGLSSIGHGFLVCPIRSSYMSNQKWQRSVQISSIET